MVRNGLVQESTEIPELPEPPCTLPLGAPSAGVEVMTLTDLRVRATAHARDLAAPRRPGFHQLFAVESGTLRQEVDFIQYTTPPGGWLWVRPGQVQRYGDLMEAEGTLVLFQPTFPDPVTASAVGLDEASGAAPRHPVGEQARAARLALDHLRFEFAAAPAPGAGPPLPPHTEVLRHLLATLLLRVTRLDRHPDIGEGADGGAEPDTFRRFRAAVERDFARSRRVADYARVLGCSPRTLSRATRAAAGLGAKEFVDRRVILEAKRLLTHTDSSAAHIAAHLGFADATNFSKFFHQRTGTAPGTFRTCHNTSTGG